MMIKYRKATPNDVDEIYNMVRNAIDAMEREGIFQWDDLYPAKQDFQEDVDEGQLYVGLVDDQIAVVYALNQRYDAEYQNGKWEYDETFYVIHRLCVNPAFQNKGIAKSTLLFIEKQLTDMGIHVIRLDVFSNNPFALRLYRSLGYSEVGFADWRKGRFILMEKSF
ncbi:MAG: GNAT family N-acetyltransferase [Christensenellaceae bacterium]|nr:GNAT family N-acetyltransferase [Christensenellaceae bacterium]